MTYYIKHLGTQRIIMILKVYCVLCTKNFNSFAQRTVSSSGMQDQSDCLTFINSLKAIVFYATISAETVNRTFDTSAIDSLTFAKIRRDLFPVLTRMEARDHFELEQYKSEIKTYLKELMNLSDTEKSYMDWFIEGDFFFMMTFLLHKM